MRQFTFKVLFLGSLFVLVMSCLVLLYNYEASVRLPDSSRREVFRPQTLMFPPVAPGPCECPPGSVLLNKTFFKKEINQVSERRKEEYEKHKKRSTSVLSKLLLARSNSPLQYPIQGVTVPPLKSRLIPGLSLYAEEQSSYQVSLNVSKGLLSVKDFFTTNVTGNGTANLSVKSSNQSVLNDVLASVSYQSTVYHVHTGDLASFSFEDLEATFPIVIKQPQLPILFDMGTDISSQVTITIKTFLRYNNLKVLLSSIRKFYPKVPVIIADDSLEPEKITGDNIQQYIMPPAQGWFAGRNLAISQVTTKYFLWVDDDFKFTKDTKIEKMIEIMEAVPELDVVGGAVVNNAFYFTLEYEEGDEAEGGCLRAHLNEKLQPLPGFPQCSLVSGVVNFFLARTDSAQKVRFDPKLTRLAHPEFFMDGLGTLMVATCKGIIVGHQPYLRNILYTKFRHPESQKTHSKQKLYYYKHNLKCIQRW